MDQVDISGVNLDFDIDLESGDTSDEDASKILVLSSDISESLLDRKMSGFVISDSLCGSIKVGDSLYPYDKFITSDEISAKDVEQMKKTREDRVKFVDKMMDKENPKRHGKPSKPPRPPRGPLLLASDMMLLKQIRELNLQRKIMKRTRTLKKMKKEKASSSWKIYFIAGLVTIIVFLAIFFQGVLG